MATPVNGFTSRDYGLGYPYEADDTGASRWTESSFSSDFDTTTDPPISSTPDHSLVTPARPPTLHASQNRPRRSHSHGIHPYFTSFDHHSANSWYERTDAQIRSLLESQNKLMAMFTAFSDRIGDIEETISSIKSSNSSSTSTSQDEKIRVPPQLSVSLCWVEENCFQKITVCCFILFRKLLQGFTRPWTRRSNLGRS